MDVSLDFEGLPKIVRVTRPMRVGDAKIITMF
jgi:hypothetical protein